MEELLLELVTAGLLAVIGWIDGRTMEIPYALSGALAICALADFFLFPGLPVGERLMGMVCVSVPMYTLCMVVKEAFGGGDILLLSIMGFYLGWRALLPGVFLGFLLGGLEAVWLLASGRAKPGEGAHMAFGPALCLGLGMERGSFSGMRGFLAEYAQGDVYMEGIKRKKEWRSGELADFFQQMAVMTGSGIPLCRALGILGDCTDSRRFRKIYEELRRKMEKGTLASSAMEQTGVFPEMAVNMIRAGEAGGTVQEMAGRLAVHYRKEHRMQRRIQGALLYPKFLGLLSVFLVLAVFLVIMPTLEPLLGEMELPQFTRFLMAASIFLKEWWYLVLVFTVLWTAVWERAGKKRRIRLFLDRLRLRLPVAGRLLRSVYTFRFAESLSILYASGIPMLTCLETAGRTVGNRYVELQTRFLSERLQNGEALSLAIRDVNGLDRRLALMVLTGEETGKLDVMLKNTADSFEYEADMAVSRLVSLVEPVMILGLGAVIGAVLLGIMVPLWRMYGYMG